MERNQTIAIVLILVIIGGVAAAYFLFMQPPPEEESIILFGTTDSVEASIDPAQSYDYFGWEIITSLGAGLVEIIPGTAAGADLYQVRQQVLTISGEPLQALGLLMHQKRSGTLPSEKV
ncbi:MAG: hypothetical protein ACXABD_12140 [Candidatus Thorarchaeota archaeon]|jgi:hypothetical protein